MVILLPNLDRWSEGSAEHGEHDQEFERGGTNSLIFSSLCLAIQSYSQRHAPVCVLATSSSGSANLLKQHQDLRNLFYRQLLVSLPNGEQRSRVLAKQILRYLLPRGAIQIGKEEDMKVTCLLPLSVADELECSRLLRIAANLHGYTTRLILFLLHASISDM